MKMMNSEYVNPFPEDEPEEEPEEEEHTWPFSDEPHPVDELHEDHDGVPVHGEVTNSLHFRYPESNAANKLIKKTYKEGK